ncbi:hypothetical protein BU15DRAFT_59966 [Melanogaster broomeanus]|nr:hypothetical protein BU15DRAFT_59966 [Melanogaster broomeanus]
MRDATVQRKSYWEEHILSCHGERRSSGLERRVDELEGENQALREDLDDADDRLTQERARAARSDQTIESLEQRVSALQEELTARERELAATREPPRDRGFSSIPQWGRGQGSHPSNFPSYRSQDRQGSGMGNAVAGPSNSRERSALPREPTQSTPRGQELQPQGKVPEARPSASGPTTMETSSRSKPTKIIQWYTAEWSEDEPASEDYDDDASPPTAMRSVGDSVVLTIDKRDVAFSGEAAKRAQSAYQKGHIAPISQGVRHFGDSASPLMISDVDRLFANAREGRAKAISQAQRYGHMLATAFEKHTPLSDAQLYGLAQWRAFHNQQTGPSMRPDQVSGAANPSPSTRVSASGGTAPAGGRAPKIAQPTYNDPPSAWTEWLRAYDRPRAGVRVYEGSIRSVRSMRGSMLMSRIQPTGSNSGTRQHFTQQSALLLMMPGQYRAITERLHISIVAVRAIGVTWNKADDACLYGHTLAQHLLTGEAPLPDNICRELQEYELRVLSADLAAWYVEELPEGMAPALSMVGPALIEAFGVSSGTVVPPGEASSTPEGPIPGPLDQDHDMEGPPAPPVMGTIGPDTGNTSTMSGPLVAEPMIVEPGELIQSVEPELAQGGQALQDSYTNLAPHTPVAQDRKGLRMVLVWPMALGPLALANPPARPSVLRLVFKSPVLGPKKDQGPNWTRTKFSHTLAEIGTGPSRFWSRFLTFFISTEPAEDQSRPV